MYDVQGTLTSPTPHPTPPQNSDIQKRAFYAYGFRGVSINNRPYLVTPRAHDIHHIPWDITLLAWSLQEGAVDDWWMCDNMLQLTTQIASRTISDIFSVPII